MESEPQVRSQDAGSQDVRSQNIRIGTAGWSYKDWNGIFYPYGLEHRKQHQLEYLARRYFVNNADAAI